MTKPAEANEQTPENDARDPAIVQAVPTPVVTPVQRLLDAMDAHDTEGERIQAEMAKLGLDAKGVKSIRKQAKALEAAKAALAKLMGEGA